MNAQCCPVCHGKGIVPNGFYAAPGWGGTTSNATPETCRSCQGQGYVVVPSGVHQGWPIAPGPMPGVRWNPDRSYDYGTVHIRCDDTTVDADSVASDLLTAMRMVPDWAIGGNA